VWHSTVQKQQRVQMEYAFKSNFLKLHLGRWPHGNWHHSHLQHE
jgi:hypothetical protein